MHNPGQVTRSALPLAGQVTWGGSWLPVVGSSLVNHHSFRDARPMDLRLADVKDHQDVLALMVRELPHLQPSELGPVLADRDLAPLCTTLVAEEESSLVGCAVLFQLTIDPPERCVAAVVVTAACRGSGIGHALQTALEAAAPTGTTEVRSRVYDDDARSLAVAEHWGYRRNEHEIFSRLDLGDIPAPDLPKGVTVTTHHDFRPPDAAPHRFIPKAVARESLCGNV